MIFPPYLLCVFPSQHTSLCQLGPIAMLVSVKKEKKKKNNIMRYQTHACDITRRHTLFPLSHFTTCPLCDEWFSIFYEALSVFVDCESNLCESYPVRNDLIPVGFSQAD